MHGTTGRRRDRILPRSVLGISALMLSASLGAAFSGAVLYAFYEFRQNRTVTEVGNFVTGFDERLETALEIIQAEGEEARNQIRAELEPLQELAAGEETLAGLLGRVAPSIFFVSTLDEAGQPSVGSAFVAFSDAEQSFLLTSFTTVRAATAQPGPPIRIRQGGEELGASLHTWDEARDLALLVVARGGLERLPWADANPPVRLGERVFAVSGLGSAGGAINQGNVADVSSAGIQHDAAVGPHFQGGPLLNSRGEVVGVASRRYAPLGFVPEDVWFGVPIRGACEQVVRCPDGEAEAPGG